MTVSVIIQNSTLDLTKLLQHVHDGEEVVLIQEGEAIARVLPVISPPTIPTSSHRQPGSAIGLISIAPDFDAPLPDAIIDAFYQ